MVICKGCNIPTKVLLPSPIVLQTSDDTGEIITELCKSCLINVLKAMEEQGLEEPSKQEEKMKSIHELMKKATELGIEIPYRTSLNVEYLEKLIAERKLQKTKEENNDPGN